MCVAALRLRVQKLDLTIVNFIFINVDNIIFKF